MLVLLVGACGDGGAAATSSSTTAASTTILPAITTTASVTIPQSTTTDVTPPWGTITGTLRDAGNGLPIGAMFEQWSGLIGVAVVGLDGVVVAWAENRRGGFFEASVAPGSYALLAGVEVYNASYWLPVWGLSGAASEITGERLWQAFADQEMVVALTAEEPAGAEWFDVSADGVVTVDVSLPQGSEVPPPGVWFEGLPARPELAVADARRDPGFWLGRIMAFEPTPLETRPSEEILLDGEATGLWAVVQSRAPQDPSLPRVAFAHPVEGHDLCWDPGSGYGFLFTVGADGRVLDAVALDLGEAGFACWHHGEPQSLPDPRPTVVLGYRERACGPLLASVSAAWVLETASLVEIDPDGAYYLYPYG